MVQDPYQLRLHIRYVASNQCIRCISPPVKNSMLRPSSTTESTLRSVTSVVIYSVVSDNSTSQQIPALLLSTLCYAFWLSFQGVGPPHFDPILWPLIWLLLAAVIMFDPLPLLFKPSRWWLLRNISRLLTSGMHRVEVRSNQQILYHAGADILFGLVRRLLDGVSRILSLCKNIS